MLACMCGIAGEIRFDAAAADQAAVARMTDTMVPRDRTRAASGRSAAPPSGTAG